MLILTCTKPTINAYRCHLWGITSNDHPISRYYPLFSRKNNPFDEILATMPLNLLNFEFTVLACSQRMKSHRGFTPIQGSGTGGESAVSFEGCEIFGNGHFFCTLRLVLSSCSLFPGFQSMVVFSQSLKDLGIVSKLLMSFSITSLSAIPVKILGKTNPMRRVAANRQRVFENGKTSR